jgi:hypothetical protein
MFQLVKRRPFQTRVAALAPQVVEDAVGLDRADHASCPVKNSYAEPPRNCDFALNLRPDPLKQVIESILLCSGD